MKFSLISLIALALTSTSVMALPVVDPTVDTAPVAKRAAAVETNSGKIIKDVPKGRKFPRSDAASVGHYERGEHIDILCFTMVNTTPVNGDV